MASWEAFRARGDVEAMKRLMLLTGLLTLLATFAAAQVVLPPIPLCVEGVIGRGLLTSGRPELPRRIEFETQVYHYETPWYDLNFPSPITFDGYVIPRTGDIRVFRRCGR
jgi:hypothetical protein